MPHLYVISGCSIALITLRRCYSWGCEVQGVFYMYLHACNFITYINLRFTIVAKSLEEKHNIEVCLMSCILGLLKITGFVRSLQSTL